MLSKHFKGSTIVKIFDIINKFLQSDDSGINSFEVSSRHLKYCSGSRVYGHNFGTSFNCSDIKVSAIF